MIGGLLHRFICYSNCTPSWTGRVCSQLLMPLSPPIWIIVIYSTGLEHHLQTSVGPKHSSTNNNWSPWIIHITPLLHKLYWLPISFQEQLKVLVNSFKALYSMRPGYLQVFLSLKTSTYPIRSARVSSLLLLSIVI